VAVNLLPVLKKKAKERKEQSGKVHGRGQKVVERIPPPIDDAGKSRDKAAALVGVNPRYVSDAEMLKKELDERGCRDKAVGRTQGKGIVREDRKSSWRLELAVTRCYRKIK